MASVGSDLENIPQCLPPFELELMRETLNPLYSTGYLYFWNIKIHEGKASLIFPVYLGSVLSFPAGLMGLHQNRVRVFQPETHTPPPRPPPPPKKEAMKMTTTNMSIYHRFKVRLPFFLLKNFSGQVQIEHLHSTSCCISHKSKKARRLPWWASKTLTCTSPEPRRVLPKK